MEIADIPRLYTAIAEFIACLVVISVAKKKVSKQKIVIISIFTLCIQCLILVPTGELPIAFWIPCMLGAVGIMYLFLYMVCEEDPRTIGYYSIRAFLLAEFVASLQWQVHIFLLKGESNRIQEAVLLIIVYGVVFAVAWYLEYSLAKNEIQLEISKKELLYAIVIVIIVFSFSNLSFISQNSPFSGSLKTDIFNIRTIVDLGGLAMLYAYQSRICEMKVQNELHYMQMMLNSRYDQYSYYQESVEMISMKYHDLKHQITGLRAETSLSKRNNWLDSLEKELDCYEVTHKTGNEIFDTILAGKIMKCRKDNIKIMCVADGTILEFIDKKDICTIFGNALDNAIESLKNVKDVDKRMINLSVSSRKSFVYIEIENFIEQGIHKEIKLKQGLPITTKKNKSSHGFGVKSIKYAVGKYGGNVFFEVCNDSVKLKILIPNNKMKNSNNN